MWQLQYLRAVQIGAELVAEADRARLARDVRSHRRSRVRRVIGSGARGVSRAATSVASRVDPAIG
jgi:hypothetical protein